MIIGLIGQKRVGKDTIASIIKELDMSYQSFALADPIKDIARILFNFTEKQLYDAEKDELDKHWNIKPREFFEQFGTDIMQFDIYKYLPTLENSVPPRTFWVSSLLAKIRTINSLSSNRNLDSNGNSNGNSKVIITDIRGQHEIDEILKYYPTAKFIHIIRPVQHLDTPQHPNISNILEHITQQEPNLISNKYINATIINDGNIDNLREKVKNVLLTF